MHKLTSRRWFAGLGVVGALVAASATSARANPTDITLDLYLSDVTVAAGSEGKVNWPILTSSAPVVLHEATLKYDFTALAGKVKALPEDSSECTTPEDNVVLCTSDGEFGLDEWGLPGPAVIISPTETAQDGDAGEFKVTFSADGQQAVSRTVKVRIGEGVDLAAGPDVETSAAPGGKLSTSLKVRNAGSTVAKGASVIFSNDYAIRAEKRYSNCTYVEDELRTCTFSTDLAPGANYTASLGYSLGEDTYAPGGAHGDMFWMTPAEFEDFAKYIDGIGETLGKPGTEGELTLDQAMSTSGFQADTDPSNNYSSLSVKVTGKNGADLAAIGNKITGKKGDVVTAKVGFRNNGPATLDYSRRHSPVTFMAVQIPTGTTAVKVPESCIALGPDGQPDREKGNQPGASGYLCFPTLFIQAEDQEIVEFGLRIDKVVPNATGAVKINVPTRYHGGFTDDLNKSNDAAKLVINPTNGGGGGGDGGTLPITGTNTGLITGIGGLLLAAGYVLTRRRRTRFVA